MRMLTRLSRNRGRTVVVSIHQPRSSIYAMFDRLMLFANGNVMYNGDASTAVDYFAALGHACNCRGAPTYHWILQNVVATHTRPDSLQPSSTTIILIMLLLLFPGPIHFNPADFFIDLISIDLQLEDGGEADRQRIKALGEEAERARRAASGVASGVAGGADLEHDGGEHGGESGGAVFWMDVSRMEGGCACTGRYHSSLLEQVERRCNGGVMARVITV